MLKRPVAIVFALVLAIVMIGVLFWAYNLTRQRAAVALGLTQESASALATLKADFNADARQMRVILLISPDCETCLRGASTVEQVLEQHPHAPVAVFAVWEPTAASNWSPPGPRAMRLLNDPRVREFWDPAHRVAAMLAETEAAGNLHPQCCTHSGFLWDLLAAFPAGEQWEQIPPRPVIFDGTVAKTAPELSAALDRGEQAPGAEQGAARSAGVR